MKIFFSVNLIAGSRMEGGEPCCVFFVYREGGEPCCVFFVYREGGGGGEDSYVVVIARIEIAWFVAVAQKSCIQEYYRLYTGAKNPLLCRKQSKVSEYKSL